MSERPTGISGGVTSTGRRRRFRDLPIWSKLAVILIVPTLATLLVGINGLVGHLETAAGADRARALAELASATGELVHGLQEERAAGVRLLGSSEDEREALTGDYLETQELVATVLERFRASSGQLEALPASLQNLRNRVENQLAGLPQTRNVVTARTYGLADTSASYSRLIDNLIAMRESSAQFAGDIEIGNRIRASAAVSRAKELLSQQRVLGHEVLIRDAYHPQLRNAFVGARAGHEQALQSFAAVATGAEQAMLDAALEGPDVRQSQLYQDYLDGLDDTDLGDPPWSSQSWDEVMGAHANLLRGLEAELDQVIVQEANDLYATVIRQVALETGVLVLMLALAVLLAWSVARSMVRSVRHLRQGALSVAQHGLPQAVARLRDPSLANGLSPSQIADQIAEPLPVRSRDEFGQLAEAFNAVHLAAVRTAAEQSQLRASVNTMFVNLARRSQILVDRLISQLDRLERTEEDPDRLAELFQLDHLATRMRRNDENLLVLAGADSTRVQRQPAVLLDVLRAAQSEVEHYTRIEFGVVDRDLRIVAHAVNDMVHLVAELLDNATAFSPPESQVVVEARRVGERAVLYVEDHGLGMSPAQLSEVNERLANPPAVDVAVSRMMGLVVVARLASRHDVTVQLRPGPDRGTIAEVALPPGVLVPRTGEVTDPASGQHDEQRLLGAAPAAPQFPPLTAPSFVPTGGEPDPNRRGRSLPAWSDLTGADPHNGVGRPTAPTTGKLPAAGSSWSGFVPHRTDDGRQSTADAGSPSDPGPGVGTAHGVESGAEAGSQLPRRRPGAHTDSPHTDSTQAGPTQPDSVIPRPRQPQVGDDPRPAEDWPAPTSAAQPSTPPQWPPVSPQTPTGAPHQAPPVSEEPPLSTYGSPSRAPASSDATAPHPASIGGQPVPRVEETMELPIFRQVESVWFRARKPLPPPSEPARSASGTETMELAAIPTANGSYRRPDAAEDPDATALLPLREPASTVGDMGEPTGRNAANGDAMRGDTVRETNAPGPAGQVPTEPGWRTAADEGWQAATQAAEANVQETTSAGLPKRRPMAQLVPGGVEKAAPPVEQRRSPEAVRGLLSAYHRGVQRGREQLIDPGHPSDGPGSTEAGKERRT